MANTHEAKLSMCHGKSCSICSSLLQTPVKDLGDSMKEDEHPIKTRVVLKPGYWNDKYREDSAGMVKGLRLHLGHLGNLYRNYQLMEQSNHEGSECLVLIDDLHKPESTGVEEFLRTFVDDLKWLNLPRLKILQINQQVGYLISYLHALIEKGKVWIQSSHRKSINDPTLVNQWFSYWVLGSPGIVHPYPPFRSPDILRFRLQLPEARHPLLLSLEIPEKADLGGAMPKLRFSLNFSIIMLDLIQGVNHLIEDPKSVSPEIQLFYRWIFQEFNQGLPVVIHQKSYKITHYKYNQQLIESLIEGGREGREGREIGSNLIGWDDPRLLTVCGLRRRGITGEILQQFCSEANKREYASIHLLDKMITKYFNQLSIDSLGEHARIHAILDPVEVEIVNFPAKTVEFLLLTPKYYSQRDLIPLTRIVYLDRLELRDLRVGSEIYLKHGIWLKIKKVSKEKLQATYFTKSASSDSICERQWLSYQDPMQVIPVDFWLYSNWYLGGKNYHSDRIPDVLVYRGLLSHDWRESWKHHPVYLNKLGWFRYDAQRTTISGRLSLNLCDPSKKIKNIFARIGRNL